MNKKVSLPRAVGVCVLCALTCALLSGLTVHFWEQGNTQARRELHAIVEDLTQMQELVDRKFVGEVDMAEVRDGVLSGYVQGLGDRWSGYMNQESYENYERSNQTSLVGVGITVAYTLRDEQKVLVIQSVEKGSPAEKAGLGAYDVVTAVDGTAIDEMKDFGEARDAILGEEGSEVTLTVRDYRTGESADYTIARAKYEQIFVTSRMLDNAVGYVRVSAFQKKTSVQFRDAVESLLAQGADSLVLDVRRNNGGVITALVDMLDELLPEGDIITLEEKSGKKQSYTSDENQVSVPMAVLVDADSYSAAEFFASALQDYKKAVVVGEQTCGKGFAQVGYELKNGGQFRLSIEKYYTKNGKSLIGTGVVPDISVSLPKDTAAHFYAMTDEEDTQLQAALKALEK